MSLPTFVIAGAQKCGTTTLHQLVRRHPQVFMSTPKEVHFFDWHWDKGLDWYSAHFAPKPKHVHAGESSPTYMYDPETRERMIKTLPDAQVVVILRDPTERAYSHYWHSRRKGTEKIPSFEEALEREHRRVRSANVRTRARYSYLDRGHYIDQIEALEAAYGRDRLHVMLLEDLVADQESALAGLFSFLGVTTKPAARIEPRKANAWRPGKVAVAAGQPGPSAAPAAVAEAAAAEEDDEPVPPSAGYPSISAETRERLATYYRPYNERLEAWLGRDLSHWGEQRSKQA
jgi:Sulfotransferase domain